MVATICKQTIAFRNPFGFLFLIDEPSLNMVFKNRSQIVNDNNYQLVLTFFLFVTIMVTNRGDDTCTQLNFP